MLTPQFLEQPVPVRVRIHDHRPFGLETMCLVSSINDYDGKRLLFVMKEYCDGQTVAGQIVASTIGGYLVDFPSNDRVLVPLDDVSQA